MRKNQRGFSLLELAVVICLMGIIGVAAVPTMKSVRRQEVNHITKSLCLDLVTQRTKQKANKDNHYRLKWHNASGGATPPYCGYTITKDGESVPEVTCKGYTKMVITPYAPDGITPLTGSELIFNQDTMSDGANNYETLYLEVKQEDIIVKASFNYVTGHYEIQS